jgi:hypothetical protein
VDRIPVRFIREKSKAKRRYWIYKRSDILEMVSTKARGNEKVVASVRISSSPIVGSHFMWATILVNVKGGVTMAGVLGGVTKD